ncbi:MAG: hypothetical protein F4X36_21515 [Gammaproteobacteria bacterium]|nr:hypothetical protein [Gammaproteobacteria bacterium]
MALLFLFGASAVLGQDAERFSHFADRGIFEDDISNQSANALVAEGIASEDAAIVELTIHALGTYAAYLPESAPPGVPRGAGVGPFGPLPWRAFQEVEGLKGFLMAHWRRQHADSGYNSHAATNAAFEQALPSVTAPQAESCTPDAAMPDGASEPHDLAQEIKNAHVELATALGFEDPEAAGPTEIGHAFMRRIPAWLAIPKLLCAIWPKDAEVLDFVWELHATDRSPDNGPWTIGLLNTGRFTSAEADAFRLAELARPRDDHLVALAAAKGLALSRRPEALAPLIAAGIRHAPARDEVVLAVAGYRDEELAPHAAKLRKLVRRGPRGVNRNLPPALLARIDEEAAAFERLQSIVDDSP